MSEHNYGSVIRNLIFQLAYDVTATREWGAPEDQAYARNAEQAIPFLTIALSRLIDGADGDVFFIEAEAWRAANARVHGL